MDPTILCIVGSVLYWSSYVNVRCAPIKELYDIVTLSCTNCLNWLKYLKNTSDNGSYDELHCWT